MVKIQTLKKIAALATAIALVVCFAVSASADVLVTTRTSYNANNPAEIDVNVTVSGLGSAAYATYYATNKSNSSDVAYIGQEAVVEGTATFSFRVDEADLEGAVKVGYTGATSAASAVIEGRSIKLNGNEIALIPNNEASKALNITYPCDAGQTVTDVTATNAVVSAFDYNDETEALSVTLTSFTDNDEDIVIAVTKGAQAPEVAASTASVANVGALVATADSKVDVVEDEGEIDISTNEGDRKLTVVGRVTDATQYGIVIMANSADDALFGKSYTEAEFATTFANGIYQAKLNDNGLFAVQIIDQSDDADAVVIKAGTDYKVAVYAYDNAGKVAVSGANVANTTVQD